MLIGSANRWALMHELRGAAEPGLAELLRHLSPVDVVLVEGFKRGPHPKIEVHRHANGKPFLHPEDPSIVALASDVAGPESLPRVELDDVAGVAKLVLEHAAAV